MRATERKVSRVRVLKSLVRDESGFTLMELSIVLVVLAILAAIAYPTYKNFTERAYKAEAIQMLNDARAAVWAYRLEKNDWPTALADVWDEPTGGKWSYQGNEDPNGNYKITASGKSGTPVANLDVVLTLDPDGNATIE